MLGPKQGWVGLMSGDINLEKMSLSELRAEELAVGKHIESIGSQDATLDKSMTGADKIRELYEYRGKIHRRINELQKISR
jgi:hypothetical protein